MGGHDGPEYATPCSSVLKLPSRPFCPLRRSPLARPNQDIDDVVTLKTAEIFELLRLKRGFC
jgi:hypothetical protein